MLNSGSRLKQMYMENQHREVEMTFEERLNELEANKEQLIASLNATIGQQQMLHELIKERDLVELEPKED